MWKYCVLFLLLCISCVLGQSNCPTNTSVTIDEQELREEVESVISALIEGQNASQITESLPSIFNETLFQVFVPKLDAGVPLPIDLVVTVIQQVLFEDPLLRTAIFTGILEDPKLFPTLISTILEKVDLSCGDVVTDIALQAVNNILTSIPPQILVEDPSGVMQGLVSDLLQGLANFNGTAVNVLDQLAGSLMGQGDALLSLLGIGDSSDKVGVASTNILAVLQNTTELIDGQSLVDLVMGVSQGIIDATQP